LELVGDLAHKAPTLSSDRHVLTNYRFREHLGWFHLDLRQFGLSKRLGAKQPGVAPRRLPCRAADGDWNATSQRSLSQFNRYVGTKFDVKIASSDALDAIRRKSSRICPMVCEHGFKADGDQCSRITCADGPFLNDDNECERRRGKTAAAKRDETSARSLSAND
jgi:hypothetical protein